MKRRITKFLALLLSLISLINFSIGCGNSSHIHNYSQQYSYDNDYHWFECECGEKKATQQHNLDNGKCICGYEEKTTNHVHKFNKTVVTDKYLSKSATCFSRAKYCYSCDCGEKGNETFEYGNFEEHKFTNFVSNNDGTCTTYNTRTAKCEYEGCTQTKTITDETELGHSWDGGKQTKNATCSSVGEKLYTCTKCKTKENRSFSLQSYTANEVYEKSKNSVGEIVTYEKDGDGLALGSCFAYSSDGKIVTNYHVIDGAYSAEVSINGKTYTVDSVLAYDEDVDLVVLKINASNLSAVSVCLNTHAVGKQVYAFGSSKGLTATFSQGIITYADREIDGVSCVQHDAAISSGNSGGPLINEFCEVIGINTMTIKDSQNLNLAVSVKELNNLKYGTPTTLAKLFGQPTTTDTFTKIKNYVVSKGEYDSENKTYDLTLDVEYGNDYIFMYSVVYDVSDSEIRFSVFYSSDDGYVYLTSLIIDKVDGVYEWSWVDGYSQFLMGNIYASSFNDNTLLGVSYYDGFYSNSILYDARELASVSMVTIVLGIDVYLSEIGVTAYSLGFVNY